MIHPLHTLGCWTRDRRDRFEHALRWRTVRRVGYDPAPYLGGGRYYLAIGVRGLHVEHEYELSRDDLERLAEAIPNLLAFVDEQWPEPEEFRELNRRGRELVTSPGTEPPPPPDDALIAEIITPLPIWGNE